MRKMRYEKNATSPKAMVYSAKWVILAKIVIDIIETQNITPNYHDPHPKYLCSSRQIILVDRKTKGMKLNQMMNP